MAMRRMRRSRRPAIRRRRFVKSRVVRKRRFEGITGTGAATSNVASINYRRRKPISRRAYQRKLKTTSDALQHHRAYISVFEAYNTDISSNVCQVTCMQFMPDNVFSGAIPGTFWTTNGGLVKRHGDSVSTDFGNSDLFLRGGLSTLIVTNLSGQSGFAVGAPIRVRTWKARTKGLGAPTPLPIQGVAGTPTTESASWDPSLPLSTTQNVQMDPYRFYSFWDEKTVDLAAGQVFERTSYMKSCKVNQEAYRDDNSFREFWFISAQSLVSGTAAPWQYVVSGNLSFTGDRVT